MVHKEYQVTHRHFKDFWRVGIRNQPASSTKFALLCNKRYILITEKEKKSVIFTILSKPQLKQTLNIQVRPQTWSDQPKQRLVQLEIHATRGSPHLTLPREPEPRGWPVHRPRTEPNMIRKKKSQGMIPNDILLYL